VGDAARLPLPGTPDPGAVVNAGFLPNASSIEATKPNEVPVDSAPVPPESLPAQAVLTPATVPAPLTQAPAPAQSQATASPAAPVRGPF